jgi:hypothetical protein
MSGYYLYGVLPGDAAPDGLGTGIGGAEVGVLPAAHGLAALVSDAPETPPEPTRRNLLTHTAVLERTIGVADVLPMRFGTIAPDSATLLGCLARNAQPFAAALAGIAGRVELGVKASWREGVATRQILAADHGLRAMRDRLQQRPASQTYQDRIELGRRVEAALEALRTADTAAILARLSPLAEREVALKVLDESMVLNRAFLVRRSAEAAFDAAMQQLGEAEDARLVFRYVGPVPPYNFVSLRADWLAEAA